MILQGITRLHCTKVVHSRTAMKNEYGKHGLGSWCTGPDFGYGVDGLWLADSVDGDDAQVSTWGQAWMLGITQAGKSVELSRLNGRTACVTQVRSGGWMCYGQVRIRQSCQGD